MATEGGGIGQDHAIADNTIVGNVGIRHDQVVIAHPCHATTFHRSAIDGDELANLVVIANFQLSGLAGVSDVLRRQSDGRKWKEAVIGANFGRALHRDVRNQVASFAKLHLWPNHTVGADFAGRMNLRQRIDNGCRVDVHQLRIPDLACRVPISMRRIIRAPVRRPRLRAGFESDPRAGM